MSRESKFNGMTASDVQSIVGTMTRNQAAQYYGYASSGAMSNVLKSNYPNVTFAFKESRGNGNGNGNATPATQVFPFNAAIRGVWSAFRKSEPTMPELVNGGNTAVADWLNANSDAPVISAINELDWPIIKDFCDRVHYDLPRVAAWKAEEQKKNDSIFQGAVNVVQQRSGVFVTDRSGKFGVISQAGSNLTMLYEMKNNIVKKIVEISENIKNNKVENTDVELLASSIRRAEDTARQIESLNRDFLGAVRECFSELRNIRCQARKAREEIESLTQETMSQLATMAAKSTPIFTPDQEKLITSAVGLGLDRDEAIALLRGKGKLA